MPRLRTLLPLAAGVAVASLAWWGPLPDAASHRFSSHMLLHMLIVGVAAPLIAIGIAPWVVARRTSAGGLRWAAFALVASLVDFVLIWSWHTPLAHQWARSDPVAFVIEQASFLGAAGAVWLAAFANHPRIRGEALAGAIGLLVTSMHMTLLAALIGLAGRPLYAGLEHRDSLGPAIAPAVTQSIGMEASPQSSYRRIATDAMLRDQRLGALAMLAGGGVVYLIGGVVLVRRVLNDVRTPHRPRVRG